MNPAVEYVSARVRRKIQKSKNWEKLWKLRPKSEAKIGMLKTWKIIQKVIQNGAKFHETTIQKSITKFDAKKGSAGVGGIRAAVPQEHLQINKITCR